MNRLVRKATNRIMAQSNPLLSLTRPDSSKIYDDYSDVQDELALPVYRRRRPRGTSAVTITICKHKIIGGYVKQHL